MLTYLNIAKNGNMCYSQGLLLIIASLQSFYIFLQNNNKKVSYKSHKECPNFSNYVYLEQVSYDFLWICLLQIRKTLCCLHLEGMQDDTRDPTRDVWIKEFIRKREMKFWAVLGIRGTLCRSEVWKGMKVLQPNSIIVGTRKSWQIFPIKQKFDTTAAFFYSKNV